MAKLITKQGREKLGQLLKNCRHAQNWSIDETVATVQQRTGRSISKSAISQLERGNSYPEWDTLATLSASEYIKHPETGEILTTEELFNIACETLSIEIEQNPYRTNDRPKLWTPEGLKILGRMIRESRERKRWSLEQACLEIEEVSGLDISRKTLCNIENSVGEPKFNTLAAIAAAGILTDRDNRALDIFDFIDIASESYSVRP